MADRLHAYRQIEERYILIIFYFAHDHARACIAILTRMDHLEPVTLTVIPNTEIIARRAVRCPLIITERRIAVLFLCFVPEIRTFILRRKELERYIRPFIHRVMIGVIGLLEDDFSLLVVSIAVMRPETEDTTSVLEERMRIFVVFRQPPAGVEPPDLLAVVVIVILRHLLYRSAQTEPRQMILRHRIARDDQLRLCRNKKHGAKHKG